MIFFFLLCLQLDEFHCPVFKFTNPFFYLIWPVLKPSRGFLSSVILFFCSVISLWYFLIFSIAFETLTLFLHFSSDHGEHLLTSILNSLVGKSVYFYFIKICFYKFIMFFGLKYIPLFFSFSLALHWFLCIR